MADSSYSEPLGETYKYNPDYHRVADFLGVDRNDRLDYSLASKLSFIRDWAGIEAKNGNTDEALWKMHDLRKKLGVNSVGKPLVDEMFKYIRLYNARQTKDNQKLPPKPKSQVKPQQNIKKIVQQTVQNQVHSMVKDVVKNKDLLTKTIQSAIKESLK